jgi:hypothetical protein
MRRIFYEPDNNIKGDDAFIAMFFGKRGDDYIVQLQNLVQKIVPTVEACELI